jgi:hypothetical protein
MAAKPTELIIKIVSAGAGVIVDDKIHSDNLAKIAAAAKGLVIIKTPVQKTLNC